MPEALPERLRTAAELIKNSQTQEARAILASYVRQYPSSEEAWFLLSYVAPQKKLQVDCLMRVLSLNPDHTEAKNRLARLTPPSQTAITPVSQLVQNKQETVDSPILPPFPDVIPPQKPPTLPDEKTGYSGMTGFQTPAHFADSFPDRYPDRLDPQTPSPEKKEAESPVFSYEDSFSSLFSSVESSNPVEVFQPKEPSTPSAPPDPVAFRNTENSPKRNQASKKRPRFWIYLLQFLGVIVVIAGLLYFNFRRPGILNVPQPTATLDYSQPPTPINTPFLAVAMTVSVTPLPSNTSTPVDTETPTLRPTRTVTGSPTMVPVEESVSSSMDVIQKQVIGLRGLPYSGPVDRSQINIYDAQTQINGELFIPDYIARLKNQSQVLAALGLITPNTDLSNHVINQLVDPYGGLYLPWRQEIIVTGIRFDAIARYTYAQEFDHYLVDSNYNGDKLGLGPTCSFDFQRCQAINALFQGDGVLLMSQWAKKYASQTDNQEISAFTPPGDIIKEPTAQSFLTQDLKFPYTAGYNFVKTLFDKGGWMTVNQALKSPPTSTMQILHPDQYLSGIKPVVETLPNAQPMLGGSWSLFDQGVLGEWNSYLLLGYGADAPSRVDDASASYASVGWAGDTYQIYKNPETQKTATVVKWDWETQNDWVEFNDVMTSHLKALYLDAVQNDLDNGSCWIRPDQIACLYGKGKQTIWIVAPDQVIFDAILKQIPDFP